MFIYYYCISLLVSGHAIETGTGYGSWLHGEAVAMGIIMATELSYKLNYITNELYNKIIFLIKKSDLPINLMNKYISNDNYSLKIKQLTTNKFIDLMSMDKKVSNGKLSLILLKDLLGNCIITNEFDMKILEEVIDKYMIKDHFVN